MSDFIYQAQSDELVPTFRFDLDWPQDDDGLIELCTCVDYLPGTFCPACVEFERKSVERANRELLEEEIPVDENEFFVTTH